MGIRVKNLVAVCYLLAAVLWLAQGCFWLFYEGGQQPLKLDLAAAQTNELEMLGRGEYATTGGDGQLIFEGLDVTGGRLWLDGEFEQYPGELDLYYKKQGQESFSLKQRVFAKPLPKGGYEYHLPPGRYTALRLDTGTEAGNTVQVRAVTLHPARQVRGYFIPSIRNIVAFLTLPALASCAIYTIMEWTEQWKNRRGKTPAGRGPNE